MSKKRPNIQVDEEKLKMMIAGDIPIKADPVNDIIFLNEETVTESKEPGLTQETSKNSSPTQQAVKTAEEKSTTQNVETNQTGKSTKRKKNKGSYIDTFLYKPIMESRRQTTILIDELNHTNILKVLTMAPGISIANFINNVLSTHFENFEEEILDMRRNFLEDLYKK